MPELPDVEVFKRYLDSTALHRKVTDVDVNAPRLLKGLSTRTLERHVKGRRLSASRRHGKYLFVRLDGRDWLVVHFGMTGTLHYFKNEDRAPAHREVVFILSNGYRLVYSAPRKLGRIDLTPDPADFVEDEALGPDALELDLDAFREAMQSRGAVKPRLMKQEALAGIGNVYSDEILFQARVHPETPAKALSHADLKRLYRSMRSVLAKAIDAKADPDAMPRSFLLPHREKGGRCPRCGGKVKHATVSGRTSWFCPQCQKR